jgi:chromosome segregation ATPase
MPPPGQERKLNINIRVDPALLKSVQNIERSLARIEEHLGAVSESQEEVVADLSALRDEVAANTSATNSVVQLVNGLADQLEAAKDNPEEVAALAAEIRANTDTLVSAINENVEVNPLSG